MECREYFFTPGELANAARGTWGTGQVVSRKLRSIAADRPFWQARYYDFNVWRERKRMGKLRYIHEIR